MEPKLTSPSVVRAILDGLGARPLKRLGQNFLVDYHLRERIVAGLELVQGERVLEIGPGLGAITERLLELTDDVWAVEVDRALSEHLRRHFGARLHLHEGDALECDLASMLGAGGKIIGNLPYYISTPLIVRVLDAAPRLAVLMLQSEVATRLAAPPGSPERGALTLLREHRADIEVLARATPRQFYPQPQVSSQVIRLRFREATTSEPWPCIRAVVEAAFRYRRKTILRALQEAFEAPSAEVHEALVTAEIDPRRRGETLTLEEFNGLARALVQRGIRI